MKKLRSAKSLYKLYEIELLVQCKPVGQGLHNRNTLTAGITALTESIYTDGEPILLGYLIKAVEEWKTIVGIGSDGSPLLPCPLSYSEAQKLQQEKMERKWKLGVVLMDNFIEDLGVYHGWNGLVNHDDYEAIKLKLLESKEHFLQHMAKTAEEREEWTKVWPFQARKF